MKHKHTHTHTHIYIYILYIYIYIYIYSKSGRLYSIHHLIIIEFCCPNLTLCKILFLHPQKSPLRNPLSQDWRLLSNLIRFVLVLWLIKHCGLFNAKSGLQIYIRFLICKHKPIKLKSSKYCYVSITIQLSRQLLTYN